MSSEGVGPDGTVDRSEGDVNVSPRRRAWQDAHVGDAGQRLLRRDEDLFLHQSLSTPCLDALRAAEGSSLETLDGRRLLDFHGNSVHHLGFGHPAVVAAVREQLERLPFCTRRYTNERAVELAERLVEITPASLDKVLLAPGGTNAISMALKLARVATGHYKTVSMWGAFHGATMDAISVGGEALFRDGLGPLLPGADHLPPPEAHGCPLGCADQRHENCLSYLDYRLAQEGDVGALVAEPIRWSRVTVPHASYWQRVREICDRRGVLLIFDEVGTGLGRTGRWFACEHFDVVPDMLVTGKALGGGVFPLAALVVRGQLDVAGRTALGHFTHEKSPVGAAAALATIDVIDRESLVAKAAARGRRLVDALSALMPRHPSVGDVRGVGLLVGVDVVRSRGPLCPDPDRAERVMYECMSRGLSFKVSDGSVLTLVPPLTASDDELATAVRILDESLSAVEAIA